MTRCAIRTTTLGHEKRLIRLEAAGDPAAWAPAEPRKTPCLPGKQMSTGMPLASVSRLRLTRPAHHRAATPYRSAPGAGRLKATRRPAACASRGQRWRSVQPRTGSFSWQTSHAPIEGTVCCKTRILPGPVCPTQIITHGHQERASKFTKWRTDPRFKPEAQRVRHPAGMAIRSIQPTANLQRYLAVATSSSSFVSIMFQVNEL